MKFPWFGLGFFCLLCFKQSKWTWAMLSELERMVCPAHFPIFLPGFYSASCAPCCTLGGVYQAKYICTACEMQYGVLCHLEEFTWKLRWEASFYFQPWVRCIGQSSHPEFYCRSRTCKTDLKPIPPIKNQANFSDNIGATIFSLFSNHIYNPRAFSDRSPQKEQKRL